MRLLVKGNGRFWDPAAIDCGGDAEDRHAITDEQRRSATFLVGRFIAGEEAVTHDIQPFKTTMAEGRFGLHVLDHDPSALNQIRARVTYNHVIEGSPAVTGHHARGRPCAPGTASSPACSG